jgi:hypothetical protein
MMTESFDSEDVNVEDRIVGEFMRQLQNSDVDFEIIEVMEGLLDENDFGGEDMIVERIEEEVLKRED